MCRDDKDKRSWFALSNDHQRHTSRMCSCLDYISTSGCCVLFLAFPSNRTFSSRRCFLKASGHITNSHNPSTLNPSRWLRYALIWTPYTAYGPRRYDKYGGIYFSTYPILLRVEGQITFLVHTVLHQRIRLPSQARNNSLISFLVENLASNIFHLQHQPLISL